MLLRVLEPAAPTARLYLPAGTPPDQRRALQAEGWLTVTAFEPASDPAAEAKRLGCSHHWRDGGAVAV